MKRTWVNETVRSLPPSGIRRFFDLVAEMKGVISLGVGEPDFVTPWHVREACVFSLEKGYTMYTSNFGLLELREEIARDLQKNYQVEYNPCNQILVTVGVSEALDLALRALIEPGDEVIIADPCYVSYKPCTIMAGGVPVEVPTKPENGFRPSVEDIEKHITNKTKVLLLCYPNNPTGAIMDRTSAEAIAALANKYNLFVISDEIYAHLTYDGKHICLASLPGMVERTLLLNGFSKAYAMTGWRLGYAAGPADVIAAMTKIHQYTMLCAPITAQKAAIEALRNGAVERERMVDQYNQRRRVIVSGLNRIGLPCVEPKGAFYAFPSITGTGMSSEEFCEALLKEEKVAVVPGNAFGKTGEGYIRCSYASSIDKIKEALNRMERFLNNRRKAAL